MDKEHKHPIDELFRQELYNQSLEPRAELWEKIEAKRNTGKSAMMLPKFWMAAAVLGIAAILIWMQWPAEELKGSPMAEITQSEMQFTEESNNLKAESDADSDAQNPALNEQNEADLQPEIKPYQSVSKSIKPEKRNSIPDSKKKDGLPGTSLPETSEESKGLMGDEVTEADKENETPALVLTEVPSIPENITSPEKSQKTAESNQSTFKNPEIPGPWSIDFMVSADINGKKFSGYDAGMQDYIRAREQSESYPLGYSAFLRANYAVNQALKIQLGVRYSRIHENVNFRQENITQHIELKFRDGYILDPFNNPVPVKIPYYDTVTTHNVFTLQSENVYQVLDIPIGLSYKIFEHKRFGLGLSGGVAFNLSFRGNGAILNHSLNGEQILSGANSPLNSSAGLGYFGGLQFTYKLGRNWEFLFEPTLRASGPRLINDGQGYRVTYQTFSNFIGVRFNL